MAKKKDPAAVSLGRRGGLVKTSKGLAMLSEEKKREIALKGVEARRMKAAKKLETKRSA